MDLNKLWQVVLAEIETEVSRPIFKTQFANSSLVSLERGVAKLGFPNTAICGLVEARYYALIKTALDRQTKQNTSLVFVVAAAKIKTADKDAGPLFSTTIEAPSAAVLARRFHLNPEFTFENYAVSTTNQLAYAAATAVAKTLAHAYNPLYIYGGVGVGKTHLMHAVANALLAGRSALRVVYCMGEDFTNDFVEAIQTKSARQFKQKYRVAQLFLVDDVQFIAGKERVQEEFFHTFNTILKENGQIILTSDRPPSEINHLEDRLRSRFEGGLAVDIAVPDFELRVAIVNIKAKALGMGVPREAVSLIAANVSDTRGLEGFLRKIKASLAANPESITPALVTRLLERQNRNGELLTGEGVPTGTNLSGSSRTGRVSPQLLLEAVCVYFTVKPTALRGPKRDRPIARPRQLFMYLCRTELGLTLEEIGGLLGGRDHTTVMHGINTITNELSTNERLREDLMSIKQRLST